MPQESVITMNLTVTCSLPSVLTGLDSHIGPVSISSRFIGRGEFFLDGDVGVSRVRARHGVPVRGELLLFGR